MSLIRYEANPIAALLDEFDTVLPHGCRCNTVAFVLVGYPGEQAT